MHHRHLFGASVLALALGSPAAFALTPDEVWANWQALSAASGATITAAATTTNGATLEVTGITVTLEQPQPELSTTTTVTIDRMTFTDKGDGTVEVRMADTIPLALAFVEEPGQPPVQVGLSVSQPGMVLIASGTAAETAYDFSTPTFTMTLTSLTLPDGTSPDVKFDGAGTDMAGHYVVAMADGKTSVQTSASIGGLTYAISGTDPAGSGGQIAIKGSVAGIKADSSSVMLGAEAMKDVGAALKAGFMVDAKLSTGAVDFTLDGTDPSGPVHVAGSFSGADFSLALDANRVDYGYGLKGAAIDATVPDLPIPIKTGWGEAGFRLALPVAQTEAPQDYAAALRLVDVTMDEAIWSMFDPGAQLKHDPVTLILDLAGGMAWTVDILQPGALEGAAMPALLSSLTLNEVLAKAVGTEIAATGGLTFDNSDLATFGGIPAPTGKITVTAKGINALIDTLVAMGLVPEDQVMGARMMLAMFAKPGAGADELISDIEFKDKAFLVNGQQLPF